jgi:hypothetical protein
MIPVQSGQTHRENGYVAFSSLPGLSAHRDQGERFEQQAPEDAGMTLQQQLERYAKGPGRPLYAGEAADGIFYGE